MVNPNFNLGAIRFVDAIPSSVPPGDWPQLWEVKHRAFSKALAGTRSQEEIDFFVGTPQHFDEVSHRPQGRLEGGSLNANQGYFRPRIVIAYDKDKPVGFINTADNVSGDSLEIRSKKMQGRLKRYRTAIEAAVDPEYQGRGIGVALALGWLMTADHLQTGTAYTFPEELPEADKLVQKLGGKSMGEPSPKKRFGEATAPVLQEGYKLITARWAARKLLLNPYGARVLHTIKRDLYRPKTYSGLRPDIIPDQINDQW